MTNRYTKFQLNQLSTLDLLVEALHFSDATYEDVMYFEMINVILCERLGDYEDFLFECLNKQTEEELREFYNFSFTSLEQC